MVLSRYTPGTLVVLSRYARGTLVVLYRYTPGTLVVLSRYARGTLVVLSRYAPGAVWWYARSRYSISGLAAVRQACMRAPGATLGGGWGKMGRAPRIRERAGRSDETFTRVIVSVSCVLTLRRSLFHG